MKKVLLTVLIVLFSVSSGIASTTYYTNKAAFNAAVSGLGFESFEATNLPVPSESLTFSGFTVSETSGINAVTDVLHNTAFGTYPVTDGRNAIWYDDNDASIGNFNFSSAIKAFGVDVTTDENSTMTVGGDISYSFALLANQPIFFGAISTSSFNSVTFAASGGPLVGFDSLSFGEGTYGVPEPTTMLLLALGMLGVVGARRKFRN
jgi:hypothetical protein